MELLEHPLAGAEFVALDTETNGLGGDLCELTEVGAVLVGGGELHETFDSLVRPERPLSRGIQRFTGITQGMVDGAPAVHEVLPDIAELLEGRVLVAHNARFDTRVLGQAFERAGLDWPRPPAVCTVALARRFAPLARKRGLATLADSLGIEVNEVHRALPDALTCARVFCALFPRLCANAVTIGDALDLLRSRRRARKTEPAEAIPRSERPDLSTLPDDPGRLRVPRRPRAAALRGQVGVPALARPRPLLRPRRLDRAGRDRGLPLHQLRARRARAGEPADQEVAAHGQPQAQAHGPPRVPALPAGHSLPGAGGGRRAAPWATP